MTASVAPFPTFLPQAVFLDRDGTVMEDRHYLSDPAGVVLLPGAGEALGRLCAAGCRLFLVSNQSGIGRGYFTASDLRACQARLDDLLRPYGACLTDARFCPHTPEANCACRKPRIGMWDELRAAWGLDPARCIMVGDKLDDVLFGIHAGFAAAFLALTGQGPKSAEKLGLLPDTADTALPPSVGSEDALLDALKKSGCALPHPVATATRLVRSLADLPDLLGL